MNLSADADMCAITAACTALAGSSSKALAHILTVERSASADKFLKLSGYTVCIMPMICADSRSVTEIPPPYHLG